MYIFIYLIKVLYKKKSTQYIFHIGFVDTYFFSIKCIHIYKGIPISIGIILAWLKYNHIQHLLSNLEISMISMYWSKRSMLFDNLIVRFLLFLKIAATIPVRPIVLQILEMYLSIWELSWKYFIEVRNHYGNTVLFLNTNINVVY